MTALFRLGWIFCLPLTAPAAVVVTVVQQKVSDLGSFGPASSSGKVLDLNSDGAGDLELSVTINVDTVVGGGGAVDILQLNAVPESGTQVSYMGNESLLPGALLGQRLPVVALSGEPGSWTPYGAGVSSRNYSFSSPGAIFQHLGGTNPDGYLGFRVRPDMFSNYLYGYLHFQFVDWTVPAAGFRGNAGNPLLVGWAYESDPGEAITVVPIPEPTAPGLLLATVLLFAIQRRVTSNSRRDGAELSKDPPC